MKLLENILPNYSPAQIRFLAFCSAHTGQAIRHNLVREWRHHRDTFPCLWEKVSHHESLIKPGSPIPCSVPQWEIVNSYLPKATVAWPIYFYLADIYKREKEGFLISQRDIQEILGTGNASTSAAIRRLSPGLINGFFPNGQPALIVMVNLGDEAIWRQRYNARRNSKIYVRSPHGQIFSIAHGEQKSFSEKHGMSETSISRIVRGEVVLGWEKVISYSRHSLV